MAGSHVAQKKGPDVQAEGAGFGPQLPPSPGSSVTSGVA